MLLVAGTRFVTAQRGAERINHARIIAQQAALNSLQGEKPFILREGYWTGRLRPKQKPKLVQIQLFKHNTYQFWYAVPDPDAQILLNMYDSKGKLIKAVEVKFSDTTHITSLIVTPESTGIYYLRLALGSKTKSPQDWALIYAYK